MKKILCYGDSNTYGFIPTNCARYSKDERWSGILSNLLAPDFEILEEGLNRLEKGIDMLIREKNLEK